MSEIIRIFSSELRAIAYEASKYESREVGGDLFGLWDHYGSAVIFLATGPGQEYKGYTTEYEMDITYMSRCQDYLFSKFGLQYLGDWHSHHRLRLDKPSSGDQNRIFNAIHKNRINRMAEIIVNHVNDNTFSEKISGYIYSRSTASEGIIQLLKQEVSPIRTTLLSSQTDKPGSNLFNLCDGYLDLDSIIINKKSNCSKINSRCDDVGYSTEEPMIISDMKFKLKI